MTAWPGREIAAERVLDVIGHNPMRHFYLIDGVLRMDRDLVEALERCLAAPLRAEIDDIDDLLAWLVGCEYVHDWRQFPTDDVWVRPDDFERTRRGDCEDHALYAWTWLTRMGLEARLVFGSRDGDEHAIDHAWVALHVDDRWLLVEPTSKAIDTMVRPLDSVAAYAPRWSVDATLVFYEHLR